MDSQDSSDEGPSSPKKLKYTINGKSCSRATYYRKEKKERDVRNAECKADLEKRVQWLELRKKLAEQMAERRRLCELGSISTESLSSFLPPSTHSENHYESVSSNSQFPSSSSELFVCPPDAGNITTGENTSPEPGETLLSSASNNLCSGDHDPDYISDDEVFPETLDIGVNNDANEPSPEAMTPINSLRTSKNLLREKLTELHGIFAVNGVTLNAQKTILNFFKSLPQELLEKLPKDGRTLRPPPIKYLRRKVHPGVVAYWGIEQMLNLSGKILFDENCNVIELEVNMDGLPLYRTPRGKGFWPMLACVNDYPVFVIGAYEGRKEPECANNYIRDFVDEVKKLIREGVTIGDRVYRFRLHMMILDSPATAFLTGVKQHGGYCACRRCKVEGKYVWMIVRDKKGVERRRRVGIRYPTIDDNLRYHEDFVRFAEITAEPHKQNYMYTTNEVTEDKEEDLANTSNSDAAPASRKRRRKKKVDNKVYHLHPTILTEIPHFDIVRDMVLDLMHKLGGHMKTVLQYHTGTTRAGAIYKLSADTLKIIDMRLMEASKYTPNEFQRKPESINELPSWKATQFLQFVLYVGAVVFHEVLDHSKLHHFHLLVVAMRLLCRQLPREPSPERTNTVRKIAAMSRKLLRKYFELGNILYGENFSRYLAHHIPHMPDDYERFERPLIRLSAFKFENANGQIKRLITGHFQPLTQLINKVSSLLYTKLYGRCEKNKVVHSVEEYYEEPTLSLPKKVDDSNKYLAEHEAGPCMNAERTRRLECFQQLQFKNFRVRTNLPADAYFLMVHDGKESYIRVEKILRDKDTLEIFLVGKSFEDVEPFFKLGPSPSDISSSKVGISLCKQLSQCSHSFPLDSLFEKCFALPLNMKENVLESEYTEWVLTRFLH